MNVVQDTFCSIFFTWKLLRFSSRMKAKRFCFIWRMTLFHFFFTSHFLQLTVTDRQSLVRRWACETMPDEFSFRRVLGSDFIKVLYISRGLRRDLRCKETRPSICASTTSLSPLQVFSANKLCSFLRGRNHGDISWYPRSYYYLRANILKHFSPLQGFLHHVAYCI